VGNRKRSVEGLIYCQRSSVESSNFQVGNEMGSVDIIDCRWAERKSQVVRWEREKRLTQLRVHISKEC
jgi:hypothetical protein